MKPRDAVGCWPKSVPVARGRCTEGLTNLSSLDQAERARAFAGLKRQQPELAGLVTRIGKRFGKVELFVDAQTAEALGVQS